MKILDPKDVSRKFNEESAHFKKRMDAYNVGPVLQDLSRAVAALKEGGIDVSLRLIEFPSELAFSLFRPGTDLVVPFTGVLRIGNHEKIFGLCVEESGFSCLKIGISKFDIGSNQGYENTLEASGNNLQAYGNNYVHVKELKFKGKIAPEIPSLIFNVRDNPSALTKFQQCIIEIAARSQFIQENDVANAFENTVHLKKLGLK